MCLTYKNLAHISLDGTERFPLLILLQKGVDQGVKNNDRYQCEHWSLSKDKTGGKVEVGMSGMQPDTR